MAYVARDGTTRRAKPFSLSGACWHLVDVADAFVRTLVIDGYAETYARGTNGLSRASTVSRAPVRRPWGEGNVRGFANVRTIDHSAPVGGG